MSDGVLVWRRWGVLGTSCKDFIIWGALPRARWPHLDRSSYMRPNSTANNDIVFSHDHILIRARENGSDVEVQSLTDESLLT